RLFKSDVKFVQISQTPVSRLFRAFNIRGVIAEDKNIAPGEERDARRSAFPFVEQDEVGKYVSILLGEIYPLSLRKRKSLTPLDKCEIITWLISLSSLSVGAYLYFGPLITVGVAGATFLIFACVLNARYSTFRLGNDQTVFAMYRGYFSHEIYLAPKESIEQVVVKRSIIQSLFGLEHVSIYLREKPVRRVCIYNMKEIKVAELISWWKNDGAIVRREEM
ncbi:MAG: PH domain-containing protein, partial [Coriobacteriia bacterium]|nr:PH domain-containing protein [Coriobacteriia bacterium]